MSKTIDNDQAAQALLDKHQQGRDEQAALLRAERKAARAPSESAPAPAEREPVPRGYWEAADGSLVPESKVPEINKERDKLVRDLVAAATVLSRQLSDFKRQGLEEVAAFVQHSADRYGVVMRGAAGKGNITLLTFDGRYKVERTVAERVQFDERLQVAKAGIDACVERWKKGSNHNIQALVAHAFRTDKQGKVSVSAVLSLRTVKIDDPQWRAAMDAIADSMHAVASVAYLRFYKRDDATGEYLPIGLNIAQL